jgi:hypothetical protein
MSKEKHAADGKTAPLDIAGTLAVENTDVPTS